MTTRETMLFSRLEKVNEYIAHVALRLLRVFKIIFVGRLVIITASILLKHHFYSRVCEISNSKRIKRLW